MKSVASLENNMELEYIDITGPDDVAKLRPFWDEVLLEA